MDGLGEALIALGGTSLACGGWTYAALWPESQLFGPVLIAGNDPDEVALTFDDGPNGDTTLRLLDILAQHDARATFFLIGRFVRQQPDIARRIASAGHAVGNHTMTHPWLHMQAARRIREELNGCKEALEDALGESVKLFRPPHGSRRPYVLQYARDLGMTTVQWNVIGEDWKDLSAEELLSRLETGIERNRVRMRGSNLLLHEGGDTNLGINRQTTLEATARLLEVLAERGMKMVAVDQWATRFKRSGSSS